MKYIYLLKNMALTVVAIVALALNSCDEIDNPVQKEGGDIKTSANTRKVLIEEYTGAKCGNCPLAAEIAHDIKHEYPNRVVLLTVHAGGYAIPNPSGEKYTYDFRTEEGEELKNEYNIIANPRGMINRADFNNSKIFAPTAWETNAKEFFSVEPEMLMDLEADYDESSREIMLQVEIQYLQQSATTQNLVVYIVEDSIVQYQTDYRESPADIPEYVHNNIFRKSLSGAFGQQISESELPAFYTVRKYFTYVIPDESDWRPEKLRLIAFVHDRSRPDEVLQVEEVQLINE